MEIKKLVTTFLAGCTTLSVIALISATPAHAWQSTYFPLCPNPGGQQIANYSSGQHWIVGNPVLQSGSDSVYSIGNNKYVQCFCPQNTSIVGIQSNWLPASSIDATEKQMLLNSGWIDVSDGSAFGLTSGEYLVRNRDYACHTPSYTCQQSTYQNNSANISNHVTESENTGSNQVSGNTGSNTQITTGNFSSNIQIENKANINEMLQNMTHMKNAMQAQINNNGAFSNNSIFPF